MNRVFIVGQRPLKHEDSFPDTHVMFFTNKQHPDNKRPHWYSGLPNDMVEESVSDTIYWMETEEMNQFYLVFKYE